MTRWQTLAVWTEHVASVTVFDLSPDTEYQFSVSASRRHVARNATLDSIMHSSTVVAKTSPAGILQLHTNVILLRQHAVTQRCKNVFYSRHFFYTFKVVFCYFTTVFILRNVGKMAYTYYKTTRMWDDAQRDGRPAEYK